MIIINIIVFSIIFTVINTIRELGRDKSVKSY